ncbi:MAG: glycosyltransferase [Mycobacteriales bacterium]
MGTAPPRRCGIATFTGDLRRALVQDAPDASAVQLAMTDACGGYDYGPEVVFEIQAAERKDYLTAAEFIDQSDVDVVCLQHEFGIFGGPAGHYVDDLLDHLKAPVVTTLHTVVGAPSSELRAATRRLADRSDVLVVLAERAVQLLEDGCGIDPSRVRVIPHGVPDAPEIEQDAAKEAIGATGRTVLLTFGLLSPSKGVEVVIEVLPALVQEHPEVLYVVLGATHPHVLRDHGDVYRDSIEQRVRELGLQEHVLLVDRYVELDELCRYLSASDVYLTPYHGTDQIVSGTLAYAVGLGCAVVSTPYPYACELLAEGRGELVPFADSPALAASLTDLLHDDDRRADMRRLAREHGVSMTWPAVAQAYRALFAEVAATHERRAAPWVEVPLPTPCFDHLRVLTDDVGVFQHARHAVPTREHGYCTDDIGRALVAAVEGAARNDDPVAAALVPGYLSFLLDAQLPTGHFANLFTYDRRFLDGSASEDTLGQALWGLGVTVSLGPDEGSRALAADLFARALPAAAELQATKAVAYAMTGLHAYLERYPGALEARRLLGLLADRQLARLDDTGRPGWVWFDDALTYANAAVPGALLRAGQAFEEKRWLDAGITTLDFLLGQTFVDGRFDFVGNEGWQRRGGARTTYGQQPIEAGLTARACVAAHEVTGDAAYLDYARAAVAWLLGRNRLGVPLYDAATGRCADGLDRHGASGNTGAESTICALLGLLALPVEEATAAPASTPA